MQKKSEMSSPFGGGDDETLLGSGKKNYRDYESGFCKKHWPVIVTGIGVVALICLGIVVGTVFNDSSSSRSTREESFPYKKIRLPGNVVPVKYRVYLHPNITDDKFGFEGNVRILVNVTNKTDSILLHSKELNIQEIKLFANDIAFNQKGEKLANQIRTKEFILSKKLEMILIPLNDNEYLDVGNYVIYIKFKGSLSGGLEGFYKSSYKTKSGEKRYLATTHFEATHARAAFPCFDEPAMKATFTIIMVREPQYTALSNMPVEKTVSRSDGLKTDHFQESVKMSTYLVAFVVCDYVSVNATTKDRNITVRVWAPREQIAQADFAIKVAPNVLNYYETFFKVPFPLPKQDLIAIPDFGAGAMENWGLITYRLTSILYDENESSSANKQWVAVVIAHELAHQWFGNLVTMKWWNDLWLNEGFAAFVEFIGSDYHDKSWKMMDQFIVDDVQSSLALDSHANSHPISVPVHNPAQINEIFDTISYDKGASIIRMMKDFIGTDAFHTGLQNYLNKYKFKNAVSDDLWACLTDAAKATNINVKSIMDTWTKQMGYPVLNVTRNGDDLTVTQQHFLIDKDAKPKESPFGYKWDVPVKYYSDNDRSPKLEWFKRNKESITVKLTPGATWFKMNPDELGFYRVNYDKKSWKALKDQLMTDHKKLSHSDRSNLMDDAFELAKAGQLDQIYALDLTEYLVKEEEYVPWITALSSVAYIGEMLLGRDGYKYYEKYMKQQVRPLVDKLGWKDNGTHLEKYLRGSALRVSVAHNDTDSVKNATKIFKEFMENNKTIKPNLRSAVYLGGIRYGGEKEWEFMFKRYSTTQYPSEQRKVMFALTDTQNKTILKRYLDMTLNSDVIRSQDSCGVIEHISLNEKGTEMAYQFVKKNWAEIYKRYGQSSFDMSSLIKTIFGRRKTKSGKEEAKKFLTTQPLGTGKLAGKQSLAAIQNHIDWLEKNEKNVVAWLKKKTNETL